MASNSFGNLFRITTFGESHGTALGVVIDGCPAGITLSEKDLIPELKRRSPGQSAVTTIAIIVENKNQRPQDYSALKNAFRPGHADEVYDSKYGHRDFRGGGRSSGRETVARVIAGVVARKVLPDNVLITGHAKVIGSIEAKKFDPKIIEKNPVRSADAEAAKKMEALILDLKARGESVGGLIEIRVKHPPENLGDPVFGKIKARLADADGYADI